MKSNKMKLPSEPLKLHSKLDFTGIFSDGKITKSLHCNAFPFTYKRGLFIFGLLFGMCDLQYIFMETRRRPLMANALYVVISTHLTFFAMLDWFWPSLTHCKKAKLCNKHHLLHVNALVHFTYYLVWRCFFFESIFTKQEIQSNHWLWQCFSYQSDLNKIWQVQGRKGCTFLTIVRRQLFLFPVLNADS